MEEGRATCLEEKRAQLLAAGVVMMDPASVYVDSQVTVGAGTVLLPGTILRGETRVGEQCEIGPNTMLTDCVVDLAEAGKLTGRNKNLDRGSAVFTFAAGTRRLYDFIDRNPTFMVAPVDYVNDIDVISAHDNMISINNTMEVDLFGQVSAETMGTRHISGSGGQQDFVLGAYRSKGGRSFICCSSVYTDRQGRAHSRLVPTIAPGSVVTTTRTNIHYLVTEYGMVNLKGLSAWQRAEEIISIAHPDFREELIAAAEKLHIWRRSNRR